MSAAPSDFFSVGPTDGVVKHITSHPVGCCTGYSRLRPHDVYVRGIPPIIDLVASSAVSSVRVNGVRQFFNPYLLDQYGDRGNYYGQRINGEGDGPLGSLNDLNWFSQADALWSPDSRKAVWHQEFTRAPAGGGANPIPRANLAEPGGQTKRILMATFWTREPVKAPKPTPGPDTISWATPYIPRMAASSGSANVTVTENSARTGIESVAVVYSNYGDDGVNVLNGWENATTSAPSIYTTHVDWFSDLTQTGPLNGTRRTSPDGFHLTIDVIGPNQNIFNATDTLSTTVNGKSYHQPANGQ